METAHFVRAISTEDVRIVKEIHFNYKFGSSVSTAKVVYLRALSEDYKVRSENGKSIYPCDELDSVIFDGLSKKYDNVNVHSWLLMCDSQIDKLRDVGKPVFETMTLITGVDLSTLGFFEQICMKKTDVLLSFPIEVYINNLSTRSFFTCDVCDSYMSLEEWKNLADRIKHLVKTSYTTLSQYLGQF